MLKLTKIACVLALGAGLAFGCGDDDDDENVAAETEGCTLQNDTCQESTTIGQVCESIGGSLGGCSDEGVIGKCQYTAEDGAPTTIFYYGGDTWTGDSANSDCDDNSGKFSQ